MALRNIVLNYYRLFLNKSFPPFTNRRYYHDKFMKKLFGKIIKSIEEESPFSSFTLNKAYSKWLMQNTFTEEKILKIKNEISSFRIKPTISIIMPVYNVDEIWLTGAINSVYEQFYENWELCIVDDASTKNHVKKTLGKFSLTNKKITIRYLNKNLGIAGASNHALTLATGEFVGFMDNDDILYPDALYEIVKKMNERPNAEIIYTDEDKINELGNRVEPFFKPDWSPNFLLSCNYITHFTVMKTELVRSLGGFRQGFDGSQDYDLLLRATDEKRVIEHIPKILYGWRKIPSSAASSTEAKPYAYLSAIKALENKFQRIGLECSITSLTKFLPFYRIKPKFDNPKVSIILYSKVEKNITRLIKIILKNTKQKFELIILTDSNIELDSKNGISIKKYLLENNTKVSKSLNSGVKMSNGDFLLFISDKIIDFDKNWLESLLEQSCLKDVGIVGSLIITKKTLLKPNYIFHAGIILGLDGITSNAFMGRPWFNTPDYYGLNLSVRNCSAVSLDCLLVKKHVFDQVGGFDENLSTSYLDVDLCLKIREKGYEVVYTPYTKLITSKQNKDESLYEDEQYFTKKWSEKLAKPDPFYNINLSKKNGGFTLDES